MRRVPIRWLLVLSLALVTCTSFILAGDLIFSAFARSIWMDYTRIVEMRLHDVLGDSADRDESESVPFRISRSVHSPIEFPTDYEGSPDRFVRSLNRYGYQVMLFDDHRRILARYPQNMSVDVVPPSSVFELLELRCRNYFSLDEGALTAADGSRFSERKRPSFIHGLFFGPVGIFNTFDGFLYAEASHSFLTFTRHFHASEAASVPSVHREPSVASNSQPLGDERLGQAANAEVSVTSHLSADGISIFCPPDYLRVTYEIPHDCQVFVAPFSRQNKLVGFVQVVSSWAASKQILYEFAAQITVVGVLLSLIIVLVSVLVSGW
ncbi:hypothetical protein IJT17_01205, partial [bacterium]|nr:hypothetical protein [bacterium]